MGSRTLNSKRNIIAGILGSCVVPAFAMIINSAIVQYFSVEYIGLISIFTSVLQILNIAELGFSSAVIVNLYRPLGDGDVTAVRGILAYYRRIYRIVGVVILISGIMVCPFLRKMAGDTGGISENIYMLYFLYLTNTAVGFILFGYKEALFNAAQRFDITKAVYITIYVIRSCLQLAALAVFRNFYLYAAVIVICTVCYNIALNILSGKKFGQYYPEGRIDTGTRQNIREQVIGVSASKVLGVSRNSINSIVITSITGLHVAGQYSNYYVICSTVLGFFLIITKAVQASIGNNIVSESVEKNYADLTRMEFLQNMVITACTAYLVSLYQPFMKLWMGEELMFPDLVMVLFVVYFYVLAMGEVRNAYFAALGYWWKAKWIFLAEALLNVVLIPCLCRLTGVGGVIIATVITVCVVNYIFVTNLLFREYFGVGRREFYTNRIIYTVITVMISAVAWYFCSLVHREGIAGIAVRMITCTSVIVVTVPVTMFLVKREYMKESVAFIRQIIRA